MDQLDPAGMGADGRDFIEVDAFLDGRGDTAAVREAISYAAAHAVWEVRFAARAYSLKEYETIETLSIAHDDGCGDVHRKECHIVLSGATGLTLAGAVDGAGRPLTRLLGDNPGRIQSRMPSVLWATGCRGLKLKNLAIARQPACASAGVIRRIKGGQIEVETFPGLPCEAQMGAYCMNAFEVKTRRLNRESVTFGFGFDKRFRRIGPGRLLLSDEALAKRLSVGEGLSWHQAGVTDFLLFFGCCEDLSLENVRIEQSNSFAVLTECCRDIRAKRLEIRPRDGQFFTGPRDGWKIYRCTGQVSLENCHIEGVRMDGQNVHSNFMIVTERRGRDWATAECRYAPFPLRQGARMRLYRGNGWETRRIGRWKVEPAGFKASAQDPDATAGAASVGSQNRISRYRIHFPEGLPDWVKEGCVMAPTCWEPERYVCRDTTFRNIAGAGHLLRCGHVEIARCRYENIMNAGILIGAEWSTHCEGGHGEDIWIHDCEFENCGFYPRYGTYGCACIAVKSQGFSGPVNRGIVIEDNLFCGSKRALEICDAQKVRIAGNRYENIGERLWVEEKSTKQVKQME